MLVYRPLQQFGRFVGFSQMGIILPCLMNSTFYTQMVTNLLHKTNTRFTARDKRIDEILIKGNSHKSCTICNHLLQVPIIPAVGIDRENSARQVTIINGKAIFFQPDAYYQKCKL